MCFVCKDNKPNSWKECFIYSASGAYYLIERQVSAADSMNIWAVLETISRRERANEQCKCLTFSKLPHCVLNSVSAIFIEVINFTHSDRFRQSEPVVHVIGFSVLFPSHFVGIYRIMVEHFAFGFSTPLYQLEEKIHLNGITKEQTPRTMMMSSTTTWAAPGI